MSGSSAVLLAVFALVTGGVGVWVFTLASADPVVGQNLADAAPDPEERASRVPDSESQKLDSQDAEIARLDQRIRELEKQLRASEGEVESLNARLEVRDAGTRATLDAVMARIAKLRQQGVGALADPVTVAALVADLRSLGEAGFQAAAELLASDNADERLVATQLLKGLGDPRAVQLLSDAALSDPDENVQTMASHSLCFMDGAGVVDACLAGLESKNDSVQVNSMFGLVRQGNQKGLDLAMGLLRDKESPFRGPMIQGIFLLSSEPAIPLMDEIRAQLGSNADVMKGAIDFYRRVGTPASRSRLQNIAGDAALPQAIRDLALAALN